MGEVSPINDAAAAYLDAAARNEPEPSVLLPACHPALEPLLRKHFAGETISDAEYQEAMKALGCSKRTVQRRLQSLRAGEAPQRARFQISEHHQAVIFACKGNVARAYTKLRNAGHDLPHLDTFWHAWHDLHPMSVQTYARKGAQGYVDFLLYPPWQAEHRNHTWQADHMELPIDVIADGHRSTLIKPWLTLFIDDCTRYLIGWALWATPGRRVPDTVVRATIAEAIRTRTEHGVEVGGAPLICRWDQEVNFTSALVTAYGCTVGFDCHAVPPYSGNMKGKVERLNRTVEDEFAVDQPGFTHGPKTYSNKDLFRDTEPLTADELRARFARWVERYNGERIHQSLGGTPAEAWAADTTALRRASDEHIREGLLIDGKTREVHKRKGVFFDNKFWMSGDLNDIVGRKIVVHHPPRHDSYDRIEVYLQGEWAGTAWPADRLGSHRPGVYAARRDAYREAREAHDNAVELRNAADKVCDDATPEVADAVPNVTTAPEAQDLYDLLGALYTDETQP